MAASKSTARETKKRIAQMEAKRELRQGQRKRRLRDNIVSAAAVVMVLGLAVVLQLTVFASNPTADQVAQAQAGLSDPATTSASPTASLPAVPNPSIAKGKTFTGSLSLNGKALGVSLDGTKAPQAAAVFKTLSDSGFYTDKTCHRLTTGDFAVLQCGSIDNKGAGDTTFTWGPVENAPKNNVYPAGTIAVARQSNNAKSNGTQFFIVYKETTIPADSAGGYTVVGKVTSGLDVVTELAKAGTADGSADGAPKTPIKIDSFTLK
ncbi:peptidyl-prolyl cis-trans isomerase B (cyclophilin B) [Psychromicrobium silvestre]|uniref:peptidylprolyl isomerase n=1 Tax=Psychromicrobium silvestre TaxID=1645614 RepID=A0A7Y9LRL7_9MICC|nr:peptidylprolyl isomerase [Psychromicrobium silvestre]NYE94314.1 peptidyl-prolyl cis-trans isomerase B (cyclophilin B) [Psychromicrobium silvestre]